MVYNAPALRDMQHSAPESYIRLLSIFRQAASLLGDAYRQDGPGRAVRVAVQLISNPRIFFMMTRPKIWPLTERCPRLLVGDLSSSYLAVRFDRQRRERRKIFLAHYEWVTREFTTAFFENATRGGLALWKAAIGGETLAIHLSINRLYRQEGDLSLTFSLADVTIYEVSFSLVPGAVIGSDESRVAFVSRVQGVNGSAEAIKRATKICSDIAPPAILVAAVQAIAEVLDIRLIAGVSNREQIANRENDLFKFDYDAFWQSFSAEPTLDGFYAFPASYTGKPLENISRMHRRRTRAKRLFKAEVAESVRAAFVDTCLSPAWRARPIASREAAPAFGKGREISALSGAAR